VAEDAGIESRRKKIFGLKKYLNSSFLDADPDPGSGILALDPGWKNSDPGSGINWTKNYLYV
jgi:hypothetical protein